MPRSPLYCLAKRWSFLKWKQSTIPAEFPFGWGVATLSFRPAVLVRRPLVDVRALPCSPCAQDDMHIRVYNYNTLERVHQFEAHSDYLRCLAVHPTQPYVLSSSGQWTYCPSARCPYCILRSSGPCPAGFAKLSTFEDDDTDADVGWIWRYRWWYRYPYQCWTWCQSQR